MKSAVSMQSPLGQMLLSFSLDDNNLKSKIKTDRDIKLQYKKFVNISPLIIQLIPKNDINKNKMTVSEVETVKKENLLLKYSNKLFSVFLSCMNPCNVLSLRLWGVRLSGHLFELLSDQLPECQLMNKEINNNKIIRIKSYATRQKENENIVENDKNDEIRINNNLYNSLCQDINEGILLLINGLNDSSDVVRYAVLTALQHCVPLILQDQVICFYEE